MSRPLDPSDSMHKTPFILEGTDSKSLHFSIDQMQSNMYISRPNELEIDYTKTMMGFLIFNRQPRHIVMVGLGGGSLAKFCYHHLPETRITVVEINPHVIALRKEFCVPDDDDRFRVIEADGADFVRDAHSAFDVLLIDGFDFRGQPAQLCSQDFYDNCSRALTDQGVMVVNLHEDHAFYENFIDRINQSFDNNLAEVVAHHVGNVIVFASKGIAIVPQALRRMIEEVHSARPGNLALIAAFLGNGLMSRAPHA